MYKHVHTTLTGCTGSSVFWGLATTCYTVGGDFEYMCVLVHLTLHLLYSFNLQVGQKKPFGKEFSAISGSVLLNMVLDGGGGGDVCTRIYLCGV